MIFTAPRSASIVVLVSALWFAALPLTAALASTPSSRPAVPALLLIEPRDSTPLDVQIRASQNRLMTTPIVGPELERLGLLYIAKALASSDPGYGSLAGIAADALERDFDMPREAWLLRGHVLQSRHRFAEAEELARRLVTVRGDASDYALLGDALYDEGKVSDAAAAYQRMVDLKPSLDSYSRAANIRWIKGDLAGAIELQTLAVRAAGPGDPGAVAWALVRLAQLIWQHGNAAESGALAARALEISPNFAPALLLQGKLLLAAGHAADALVPLARVAELLPLPEPLWTYADALRAAGRAADAAEIERRLVRDGPMEDPRTVALFLATRGCDALVAVRLATAELKNRADIMTQSIAALALANAGRISEAGEHSRAAQGEGTVDARVLLHAGRVAALSHQPDAGVLLNRAGRLQQLLLPSERRLLEDSLNLLPSGSRPAGDTIETTHEKTS